MILRTPITVSNNVGVLATSPVVQAIVATGMERIFHRIRVFVHVGSPPVDTSIFVDDVKFATHGQVVISALAIGMEWVGYSVGISIQVCHSSVFGTIDDIEVAIVSKVVISSLARVVQIKYLYITSFVQIK
jgi:hypothetical protein